MSNYILKKAAYYYYNLLPDKEKNLYKVFLNAMLNMTDTVDIKENFTNEQVQKVSRYVMNDRPDIFWYRGTYTWTKRNDIIIKIKFHYIYTAAQKEKIIYDIERNSFYKQINAKIAAANTEFEKALIIYEFIIKNAEYETTALKSTSSYYNYAYGMEGVILKRRAVCSGYAKTYQYFANKHNIWCTFVTGQTKRESHAWNLIKLYGKYYYIDATWGDPIFLNNANKDPDYISYDYFCITTESLCESHRPIFDDKMPVCTATECNYYKYFGMIDDVYSVEKIAVHIINAVKRGKKAAVVKYSSSAAYERAIARLFKNEEIFNALKIASRYVKNLRTDKVQYNVNANTRTISINI